MKSTVLARLALSTLPLTTANLNFLVVGDWGGDENPPFTTDAEVMTAQGMEQKSEEYGARFAVSLGDNFYHSGVVDVHDERFQTTFENVFTGPHLQGTDFFRLIAGNHDHVGNASAQLAYSEVSDRWMYPDYFYDFTESVPNSPFTVQIVMLDTVIWAGQAFPDRKDEQMTYLAATLAASTADHIVVAGHYPIWSVCEHGPTPLLVDDVKPLLEQYNVSVYLAGHDHCAEVIVDSHVAYHGIGSAGYSDPSLDFIDSVPANSLKFHNPNSTIGGFARIEVDEVTGVMVVEHYDGAGSSMYLAEGIERRNVAAAVNK
jgi:tartrate-resistant acid phosphatase type 5